MAARRGGIKTVVIPKENARDLKEIPDNILENLEIKPVKWIDEVLAIALERVPDPITDEQYLADAVMGAGNKDQAEPTRPPAH